MHTYTDGRRVLRQGDGLRRQGRHGQRAAAGHRPAASATTPSEVGVGGVVPGVLALDITGSANFGAFLPGVTRDYTASLAATATSTATAAELTVRDPSTDQHRPPGQRLVARWRSRCRSGRPTRPTRARRSRRCSETGARLRLLAFPAPVSAHAADDRLQAVDRARTSRWSPAATARPLVFTLSATTP